jgi:3-carboxy-cis,cis-muconate cycloisomerase
MPQEHERALGNWQAEVAEWPGLLMSAHGSARAMGQALPGLEVDGQRMLSNLQAVRAGLSGQEAEEWFSPALALDAGKMARAQVAALSALNQAIDAPAAEALTA